MRKRYSRSYTVLSFLTMFSYREQPFRRSFFLFFSQSLPLEGAPVITLGCAQLKVSAKLTGEGFPIPPAGVLSISPAASAATNQSRPSGGFGAI